MPFYDTLLIITIILKSLWIGFTILIDTGLIYKLNITQNHLLMKTLLNKLEFYARFSMYSLLCLAFNPRNDNIKEFSSIEKKIFFMIGLIGLIQLVRK
jgi:hypothetical protein